MTACGIAEFAGGKPWAHIDIAAAAWNTNLELTTVLRGPSGAGTRLCIELAELMVRRATDSWPPSASEPLTRARR